MRRVRCDTDYGSPEDYSIRLVREAIDAEINYFDTAGIRGYGTENRQGDKGRRDGLIIATKTAKRTTPMRKRMSNIA